MFVYGSGCYLSNPVEAIRPGTIVSFGMYRLPCGHKPYQDGDPEIWMDIDWIVLDVIPPFSPETRLESSGGHKALMITRDCLDWDFFDYDKATWEGSSIQHLMNQYMYEQFYFPEDDRSAIIVSPHEDHQLCCYFNPDYFFLLTLDQVLHYFPEEKDRRSEMHFADELRLPLPGKSPDSVKWNDPDTFILKNEVSREPSNWWTCTPYTWEKAKDVLELNDDDEELFSECFGVDEEEDDVIPHMFAIGHQGEPFIIQADADEIGIRPAVWVDLDKVKIKR
ncbi:MAG: DUF6273 domain-containing protein [Eubacterium sp.]|nr:DUF6273 domain-containing protein [Eubacterium sp.]